MKLIVHVDAVV